MITNQKDLRRAFWADHPDASRKRGKDGDYKTDTRVSWCDFIEHCTRSGLISESLAQRATLEPRRYVYEFQIQTDYGYGHGWEETCCDVNWSDARATIREYRENQPEYPHRIKRVRRLA